MRWLVKELKQNSSMFLRHAYKTKPQAFSDKILHVVHPDFLSVRD